jgi:hypothetical protein
MSTTMDKEEAPTKKPRLSSKDADGEDEKAKLRADTAKVAETRPEKSTEKVASANTTMASNLAESEMEQAQKVASIIVDQKQLAILKNKLYS